MRLEHTNGPHCKHSISIHSIYKKVTLTFITPYLWHTYGKIALLSMTP